VSSRFVTVLPVIAAVGLLMSALGIVAGIAPESPGYTVAAARQPLPPMAVCPVSEAGGVVSTASRSRRRLL
jgi:hypothetical protein